LLVIGGAENHTPSGTASIPARFVELSGGAQARVVVIAAASGEPSRIEAEYVEVFKLLGAASVVPLRLEMREQANGDRAVELLEQASGVFFTGGDQMRIGTIVGGSRVDSVLHARLSDGLVLAGTSAGAAMMSGTMIIGGQEASVSPSSVRTGPGLEFLPGVLIDMHFAERGRLNRLLSAIALYPHELGVGIDEDTAILVEGDRFEVIGTGSVTVIDAGPATTIRTPVDGAGPIALSDVRLHVLPAGCAFALTDRRPLVADAGAAHSTDAGAAHSTDARHSADAGD
jgi:cyanophycinase